MELLIFIQYFHSFNSVFILFFINLGNLHVFSLLLVLKIQDGRRRSKVKNRPNFTPQITFRLIIWIRFIRFKPNLAGRYSTKGTTLRKNFWPIAKSKMAAAAAITANYEIGHNLKSIQLRDPIFSSHRAGLWTAFSQEEGEKEEEKVMFLQ